MWDQFFEKKMRAWVYPLALLLVLNLFFLFVFTRPSGKRLENKDYDIREALKSASIAEQYRDVLRENLERIRRAENDIEAFKNTSLLKREGGFTTIRSTIGEITKKEGVNPETISYNNKYLEDYGLTLFSMKIPLGGAYNSLRRIIGKVEESDHFLVIKEVELKEIEEARGKKRLELGVILMTYFAGN